MPQRFLRPGITTSDRWNSVSFAAQSLYVRILTLVDDFGRYDARIPILHGECFALRPDMTSKKTTELRDELHSAGLIRVYSAGGKEFLQVLRWQERARSEKSKFPEPDDLNLSQDSAADRSGPQDSAASLAIALATTSSPSPSGRCAPDGVGFVEGRTSNRVPATDQAKRIAAIFHRKLTTPWSAREVESYHRAGTIEPDDLIALEAYYAKNWPPRTSVNILRHDLLTFLNNLPGEIDRAHASSQNANHRQPPAVSPSNAVSTNRNAVEQYRQVRKNVGVGVQRNGTGDGGGNGTTAGNAP